MPEMPSDIRAAMTRRAKIKETPDAVAMMADLLRQYDEQQRAFRRLGALYDRARAFKTN